MTKMKYAMEQTTQCRVDAIGVAFCVGPNERRNIQKRGNCWPECHNE